MVYLLFSLLLHLGAFVCMVLSMKAIPCPIPPEALRILVHEDKFTDDQIARRLGETKKRVQSWRKRFKITALPRWERHSVIPIEGKLKSLLVGSMLGDGRLVRRTHSTYYTESHCKAQVPYLEWKANMWGPWIKLDPPVYPLPGKEEYPQFGMRTCSHASLNSWQEMFYSNHERGWKRLVPEVVDHVDAFALAIWYLDDGHAGWWPGITFGADERSRAIAWTIFEKFGLEPRWQLAKRTTGTFYMEREDTAERFLDIIKSHVPGCMSYKLSFGFQGPHYQVRKRMDEDAIRDGVDRGVPVAQMARELGVGSSTLRRKIRALGIDYKPKRGRPPSRATWLKGPVPLVQSRPVLLAGEGDKMHSMIQGGLTGQEVADLYNVHKSTVAKRIREAGHPPLKPGPRKSLSVLAATTLLKDKYPDTSLWKGLDEETQEAWEQDILSILQRSKFPYPSQPSDGVRDKKMASFRKKPLVLDHSTMGLNLCYPFFPNRYKARYRGKQSAFEAWYDKKALRRAIRWQLRGGDPVTPARVLKAVGANSRTPTVFRPSVAAYLYKTYCQAGDTVWDPCAGFGGRLVGAYASGVKYIGTDVSPETVEGNKRLAEWLGAKDAKVHLSPAEDFDPPAVQMVMTSPPYFQQEQYTGGKQSWSEYDTFDAWVDGFLRPMIERGAQALTPGGHWVMNIADVAHKGVTYPLVSASRKILSEVGLVEVGGLEMPISNLNRRVGGEPILVWRKPII